MKYSSSIPRLRKTSIGQRRAPNPHCSSLRRWHSDPSLSNLDCPSTTPALLGRPGAVIRGDDAAEQRRRRAHFKSLGDAVVRRLALGVRKRGIGEEDRAESTGEKIQ